MNKIWTRALAVLTIATLIAGAGAAGNAANSSSVDPLLAEAQAITATPGFSRLAPTIRPTVGGDLTAPIASGADAALLGRINDLASSDGVAAIAAVLDRQAGTRNHSDYWAHYYDAQQNLNATIGGINAAVGVWTVLVVPGIQRCGADANCIAFWILIGEGLTVVAATYTAGKAADTALDLAAFAQSGGAIGYRLLTWVVVCVYAGQQCDQPPI